MLLGGLLIVAYARHSVLFPFTLHFIHYYFLNWIYTNTFVQAITVQFTFVE